MLDAGWTVVPTSANFAKQKVTVPAKYITEAGYYFTYLSYEGESNNYVYFDDYKVRHVKSNLIQGNEYYPFGMQTANSWTRESVTGNNYLANGGTELNQTSQLYDLMFRNYDPALGRMFQVDPVAAKYASLTPYNYSFNNPAGFSDPSGADPDPEFDRIRNSQNYYHNGGGAYGQPGLTYDDYDPMTKLATGESQCARCWDKDNMMGWMSGTGSMDRYWHPGDGRMFWSGYERGARERRFDEDRVRYGEMSKEQFDRKYPSTSQPSSSVRSTGNLIIHTRNFPKEKYAGSGWTVVKATGLGEIEKTVKKFAKMNGGKLNNLVIVGHGSQDAITLGGGGDAKDDDVLGVSDFQNDRTDAKVIKEIIESVNSGGNLVFASCFGGKGGIPFAIQNYVGETGVNVYLNKDFTTIYEDRNQEYIKFGVGLTIDSQREFGWVNLNDNNRLYSNIIINRNGTITVVPN